MKLIDSIKQCEGAGGTLEIWLLNNKLRLSLWKDDNFYHLFIRNIDDTFQVTKSLFDKLNHPYNEIKMEYGSFMPPKIKMEHKYFEKFVTLAEKIDPSTLDPDPFSG